MKGRLTAAEHLARKSKDADLLPVDARCIAARHIVTANGKTVATFANDATGRTSKRPINISAFDLFDSECTRAFQEAYVLHCMALSPDRRYSLMTTLKSGFIAYLAGEKRDDLTLGEIDEDLLAAFKHALDRPDSPYHRPAITTRKIYVESVQMLLKQLLHSPYWQPRLSPRLRLLTKLYPKAHHSVVHTSPVSDRSFDELIFAACDEIELTVKDITSGWTRMKDFAPSLSIGSAGTSASACAAYLHHNYDGIPPSLFELGRQSVEFTRALPQTIFSQAERLLFPTLRDLVPFIIVTTSLFALNPAVILNMKLEDFELRNVLQRRRLKLLPYKARADRRQRLEITVTGEASNPGNFLPFIVRWTARLRSTLQETSFAEHFWLRSAPGRRQAIPLEKVDSSLTEALAQFCDDKGLKYPDGTPFRFTLKQLRPTALDRVHELTGGDVTVVQAVANHSSARTTEEFYRTAGWVMRNEERLAQAMNLRHRHLANPNLSRLNRSKDEDLFAATPGFTCLDPYDSPFDQKGKLCAAYGMCPACPLGVVDYQSPVACSYLHQLRARIDEAQVELGGLAWLTRWAPVKTALLLHLRKFEQTAHQAASSAITAPLPSVE